MKLTLLLILMAITVGYCGKNKTDLSEWRKVFERGEGSSRPSKLRRTSALTQQQPANPRPGISECECGEENVKRQARIVGGNETIPHRYPWAGFVHYMHQGIYSQYGVSIITNWHLLTTAKAVDGVPVKDLFVSVGVHKVNNIYEPSQELSVERVVKHPNFDKGNQTRFVPNNDIAIIITKERINFAAEIGPVCLPRSDVKFLGKKFKALGWGATLERESNNVLMELGDEGGCLLYQNSLNRRFTQVGIISYNAEDCRSKPSVATDVNTFTPWISNVIVGSQKGVTACYGT